MEDCTSLSDFCDPFYASNGSELGLGQIVYCPVPNIDRRPYILEIERSDGVRHDSAETQIRKFDHTIDYRGKDRLPIAAIENFGDKDELILSVSKIRPCLIAGTAADGINPNALPQGTQRNLGMNAFDNMFLLAPIYSVSHPNAPRAFGPVMTARVKAAYHPEFLFLPQHAPAISNDSVARFDRLFASPLMCGVNPRDLWLGADAIIFMQTQISWLLGITPDDEYMDLRELLISDLPTELIPS